MITKHYQFDTTELLNQKAFEAGAIYYVKDTARVYIDPVDGSERILFTGDPIIMSKADFDTILAPIPGKIYYVPDNNTYNIFHGGEWYSVGNTTPRAGIMYPYPVEITNSAPLDGFLWCDGASYLRSDYPELFAVIGATYGADDDAHFNVPDTQARYLVGQGTGYNIGASTSENKLEIIVDDTSHIDDLSTSYTVVNYIISTGRAAPTMSAQDFITGVQTLPLGIQYGGHGGTTAATARANLGVPSLTDFNALSEKVGESMMMKCATVLLPVANWTAEVPYTQSVAVEKMTEEWIPGFPVIVPTGTMEGDIAAQQALTCLSIVESFDGNLTFTCYQKKPTIDITIRVPGMVEM